MDAATPHRNPDFKQCMGSSYDTRVIIIPGGLTPLVQPADVCWNKSIKAKIKKYWVEMER